MTHKELKRIKKIHGIGFKRTDIPTIIRKRDAEKSEEEKEEYKPYSSERTELFDVM